MVKVEAEISRNILYITADQALGTQECEQLIDNIRIEAQKLGQTWVAAVDLRGMWIEDLFFCDSIKHIQTTLLECGAHKIGTLLDNTSIQMFLGQAGMKTHSNEVAQRFFNQTNWEAFISEPVT
jgi:hypothetical protein